MAHTPVLLRPFAFLPFRWFQKLSREERPRGSLPAFAWDDVSTPIRPITGRHSLSPRSCSRTAMGRLCSLLSPEGAIRGFHVPLAEVRRVRCLLLAGRRVGHGSAAIRRCPLLRTILVQAYEPLPLVVSHGLYRRFKCFHHTDYLALIRPVAARRVRLSRFAPRALRRFVTLSEPLFIQAPRFTR